MSLYKAYSYLRFSTPEQAKGDSKRRQTELAEAWAVRHGMELDTELSMQDLGVSAFRGDNTKRGALSLFRRAVEDGLVHPGSVLLVENLDRISRQAPWDALPVFQGIINEGVDIVTLADEKRWSKEDLRENPLRIMESLLVFIRANEESRTKSRRLAAVWVNKRKKAAEGIVATARAPAWLEVGEQNGLRRFKIVNERAQVVQQVFQWAADGIGQHSIAHKLNQANVPTFGAAKFWHRSYIAKILKNEAVVGKYTPAVVEHDGERKSRVNQKPIENYFPSVVSLDVFQKVQAITSDTPRGKARNGIVRNVLAGLARCGLCGSSMTRVNKGAKGGKAKLICTKAKVGAGCSYHSVDLESIEYELKEQRHLLVGECPAAVDYTPEILNLEDELEGLKEMAENLAQAIAESPSETLKTKLSEVEHNARKVKTQIKELINLEVVGRPIYLTSRLKDVEDSLADLDKPPTLSVNREKCNAALKAVLKSVIINPADLTLTLNWKHGGESYVLADWSSILCD